MRKKIKLTEKGKALLLAIDCGLCPKNESGYYIGAFEDFWKKYTSTQERNETIRIFIAALLGGFITRLIDFLLTLL